MAKTKPEEINDIEECRDKINKLLEKYNCSLMSADEYHSVLIYDNDTHQTEGGFR